MTCGDSCGVGAGPPPGLEADVSTSGSAGVSVHFYIGTRRASANVVSTLRRAVFFFFLDLANPETTPALAYGAKDVPNLQQTRKAKRPDYRPRFCTPSGKFFAPFRIACVSVAVFFSLASCRIEEKSVGCLRLSVAERFAGLVCLVSLGTVHRISRSPLSCSHLRGFPIGATHLCFLLRTSIQSR